MWEQLYPDYWHLNMSHLEKGNVITCIKACKLFTKNDSRSHFSAYLLFMAFNKQRIFDYYILGPLRLCKFATIECRAMLSRAQLCFNVMTSNTLAYAGTLFQLPVEKIPEALNFKK